MVSNEVAVGLIGAGGAVVAQALANGWSARRDARRFEWERGQATKAEEVAKAQRFSDRRRVLFVDLLALIRQTEAGMRDGADRRGDPRAQYLEWKCSVDPILAEVQILDPDVYLRAQSVYSAFLNLFTVLEQSEAGVVPFSSTVDADLQRTVRDLLLEMRKALQIPGKDWYVIGQDGNLEPID